MNNNFPRTLSLLRKEKRISQRQAASELGVSQAVLSHYENGVREPGLEFVAKAADFYRVSTDFLLGRTMSREDYTIRAEDIPDITDEKDNVMRGSILAAMNKKLIVNAVSLIFDIIGKSKNKEVVRDAAMYMDMAVYRLFRHLYAARGDNSESFFAVPDAAWVEAADAAQRLCEMRYKNAVADRAVAPKQDLPECELPELSAEYLKAEYPQLLQSLLSVLQSVAKEIDEYI